MLIDRAGYRNCGGLELLDVLADRTQRLDARTGRILHGADLLGDFLGRAAGLVGQFLDLARHHRESATGLAAARSLDRGVEREQIGPPSDRLDQFDDLANLICRCGKRGNRLVGVSGGLGCLARERCRVRGLTADLADGHGEFVRRGGGGGYPGAGLLHRFCHLGALPARLIGDAGHRAGGGLQLRGRSSDAAGDIAHRDLEILCECEQGMLLLKADIFPFLFQGSAFLQFLVDAFRLFGNELLEAPGDPQKDVQRVGQGSDFIFPVTSGNRNGLVAACQPLRRRGQFDKNVREVPRKIS